MTRGYPLYGVKRNSFPSLLLRYKRRYVGVLEYRFDIGWLMRHGTDIISNDIIYLFWYMRVVKVIINIYNWIADNTYLVPYSAVGASKWHWTPKTLSKSTAELLYQMALTMPLSVGWQRDEFHVFTNTTLQGWTNNYSLSFVCLMCTHVYVDVIHWNILYLLYGHLDCHLFVLLSKSRGSIVLILF
jgi:hypothetical protein